jgi:hypothetical protein
MQMEDQLRLYRFGDSGYHGTLWLAYAEVDSHRGVLTYNDLSTALRSGAALLDRCRPLLNDRCWYWKWNPEYELERKYTFATVPDTWQLVTELYDDILAGRLAGFVPETDMEFQVFDYESTLFEVIAPAPEAGYISFIPQADGRMAIKRKWFQKNAELRRETVTWGNRLTMSDIGARVRSMTSGDTRRLAVFRRKRFDVNFESLESGHVFGVYFDICRACDGATLAMSQCEVEYCRTRTLREMTDVYPEFERVADYTATFLSARVADFQKDLYSKLDFARSCFEERAAMMEENR